MMRFIVFSCLIALVLASKRNTVPECNHDMKNGCPKIFMPLCATNGRTYANLCELCVKSYNLTEGKRVAPLKIQYEGECEVDGDKPVNGQSDQAITPDGSIAGAALVELCAPHVARGGACTYQFQPVCGSDGVSYGNLCALCWETTRKKDLTVTKQGPC